MPPITTETWQMKKITWKGSGAGVKGFESWQDKGGETQGSKG